MTQSNTMSDRAFGLVLGTVCCAAGILPALHAHPVRPPFLWIAGVLWALGLLLPRILHWPKTVWLAITTRIGNGVQAVLMGTLFFGVITPVAVALRLIGRDALRRRWEPDSLSYWIPRTGATDMKQQF
jgi:hypothetical protein